ncbi:MAG: amidophosphoribosyltransferase [Alphaproteobacteria bacterium]|nr:amidophosphoribosyltransferase [Alphaproteobacteria bacterium]MBV8548379.1 amidophosphoribosyltransferase [Alphaproteobacteria bacterium]
MQPFAPQHDDKFHEECGVVGLNNHDLASAMVALGLHALQHRGQEAAGIVSYDGHTYLSHHALGHVGENFHANSMVNTLKGYTAIGHTRYATSGETALRNVQPFFADFDFGGFALGHNGNLTNAYTLKRELVKRGCIFRSTSDTEVVIHLMAVARGHDPVARLIEALKQVEGAYSLVAVCAMGLIGVRDPHGVRPLCLGKVDDSYVLASETCALDIIGADFVRDIEPGEVILITKDGKITSQFPFTKADKKFCIFEYIYFARPDSTVEGHSVYEKRKNIGVQLAKEAPVAADIIVPVPDSGVPSAIGYSQASGVPFELGIIRNHYVGRTFIQPTSETRHHGVKMKHNANRRFIEGKRVVLVDDSIVRGTTSIKIVEMIRQAGAKEVHMRITSPPSKHSCYYGIDTPEPTELMAHSHSVEEMAKIIGVDSLAFISLEGLYRAMGETGRNDKNPQYCDACFSGDYAIRLTDRIANEGHTDLSYKHKASK